MAKFLAHFSILSLSFIMISAQPAPAPAPAPAAPQQQYYCTHFLYDPGVSQNLCPPATPPLTYYPSVHLCCKNDNNLGHATIYKTFTSEPPRNFPAGCQAAVHDPNIGQYECTTGEDAYRNWDRNFPDVIPVCCTPTNAPAGAVMLPTAHLGTSGIVQQPAGGGFGGSGWPYSGRPRSMSSNHIGGGRGCRDWIPPSGMQTCAEKVALRHCELYPNRMQIQCPVSCGFC